MDDQTVSKVPANAYSDSSKDPLAGNRRWDHGHMAANDAIAKVFGKAAQLATFKMSNMCPQSHRLNGGKWKVLEGREYKYSQSFGEVWTICGPIFEKHLRTLTHGIEVPSSYYKILVRKDGGKLTAMAVKFEYYPGLGGTSTSLDYLNRRLKSIAELETLTGLDFFSGLPNDVEQPLEVSKADAVWGFP